MASISYQPLPEVLAGLATSAKDAGFRKFRTRFRLATEGGHGLVLHGSDGKSYAPDGHRYSHWYLAVCLRSWADLYQSVWDRPPVADPLKFDPDRHAMFTLSLKGRREGEHPCLIPADPQDVEDFVRHVNAWFSNVALPLALGSLRDPSWILNNLDDRRGSDYWHPETGIMMPQLRLPMGVVLGVETGNHDLARRYFTEVVDWAERHPQWSMWIEPLEGVLARHGVEVPS